MMGGMRGIRILPVAALAAVLVLAGCGKKSPPKAPEPAAEKPVEPSED